MHTCMHTGVWKQNTTTTRTINTSIRAKTCVTTNMQTKNKQKSNNRQTNKKKQYVDEEKKAQHTDETKHDADGSPSMRTHAHTARM